MKPVTKRKNLFTHRNKIKSGSKKVQDCWSRLNASRAARNSFAGRMFVSPVLKNKVNDHFSRLYNEISFD